MRDQEKKEFVDRIERETKRLIRAYGFLLAIIVLTIYVQLKHPTLWSSQEIKIEVVGSALPQFENGLHVETGLKEGENLQMVISNCTNCHSAKMITQNRATREGWLHMIEWMQETQGLWELGDNEPLILDYLAANYAPEKKGRRAPLMNIDWYDLDD